ncbi:hypothetical protein KBB05_02310 [Patescibacteria group bacterium]|nr:hypothetical protein [Patescibacteria group bacterium]
MVHPALTCSYVAVCSSPHAKPTRVCVTHDVSSNDGCMHQKHHQAKVASLLILFDD